MLKCALCYFVARVVCPPRGIKETSEKSGILNRVTREWKSQQTIAPSVRRLRCQDQAGGERVWLLTTSFYKIRLILRIHKQRESGFWLPLERVSGLPTLCIKVVVWLLCQMNRLMCCMSDGDVFLSGKLLKRKHSRERAKSYVKQERSCCTDLIQEVALEFGS
ncbi:hypothetical protein S1001342_02690 (plasmid) [Acetobacter pasteurianus subsp. pasteurianus]|uniref:Uncharacterized protein n=1 Tax=Acetobacter pasteurianus subsp. pasteurianus TaxID=481145 RepID=A0A1Y0Y1A4_ACEPA|nr:hypothetical protein S1001342_02667 [Acetobacter pasteurianus subsp. pasteurianus]ARW48980.1 hypothetical protein S1001342_02690 [Acetobacter pasteurianus subsp. pasteurianus]